jgi:hypothetical protein
VLHFNALLPEIVSSMIAKSHDTNYKILVAKRNDKNIL